MKLDNCSFNCSARKLELRQPSNSVLAGGGEGGTRYSSHPHKISHQNGLDPIQKKLFLTRYWLSERKCSVLIVNVAVTIFMLPNSLLAIDQNIKFFL